MYGYVLQTKEPSTLVLKMVDTVKQKTGDMSLQLKSADFIINMLAMCILYTIP